MQCSSKRFPHFFLHMSTMQYIIAHRKRRQIVWTHVQYYMLYIHNRRIPTAACHHINRMGENCCNFLAYPFFSPELAGYFKRVNELEQAQQHAWTTNGPHLMLYLKWCCMLLAPVQIQTNHRECVIKLIKRSDKFLCFFNVTSTYTECTTHT